MDLRNYFSASSPKSALSELKAAKATTSKEKKSSPRKGRSQAVPAINLDEEDEDESPLPPSLLKKSNRQRVRMMFDDSDDDMPVVKKKPQVKEKTVSPRKPPVKKRSRVVSSESPSPVREKTKSRRKKAEESESEFEVVADSDSMDEFTPETRAKWKEQQQKTHRRISFASQEKKSAPAASKKSQEKMPDRVPSKKQSQEKKVEPAPAKKHSGKTIDPSELFGGPARSTVAKDTVAKATSLKNRKAESPKKAKSKSVEKKKERDEFSEGSDDSFFRDSPKREISPILPLKKREELDEFSEDSFGNSPKKNSPKKMKSPPKPSSNAPPRSKKRERERDEFSEDSCSNSPKKPVKQSKSEKTKPVPAPVKTKSDPPKETPKIPAPAKNVSKSQPNTVQRDVKKEEKEVFVPWVDKYKPKSLQQLVGQHGDKSPMRKLMAWLSGWKTWHLGEGGKIKRSKPPPGVPTDGSPFKAVLLSGPPGVGKTSCAHLACELAGYKVVEMNASDVRNKKSLDAHIAQLTGSHQLEEYFGGTATDEHDNTLVHHVLIMDEVDGMSGNEDRGGLRELVDIINDSKIPVICICNDRSQRKMQTLTNHTYDVRFPKPRAEMLLSRVMTICLQEKLKLSKEEAMELIELSGHDVRQTIYNLQLRAVGGGRIQEKDCVVNTFDAARRLLGQSASLAERQQMFFVDYSLMPLFVQDNYPKMAHSDRSQKGRSELACLRKAADLLAWGDTVERTIRSSGAWKMLPVQSMLSAALPTLAMDGQIRQMINFPLWLGKNSNAGKRQRMLRQIEYHANLKISGSPSALITDYLPVLRQKLTTPLIERKSDGIPDVVETMNAYSLVKDDVDAIAELAQWPNTKDPYSLIPPAVKAALTRTLNKTARALPYQAEDVVKGRKKAAGVGDDIEMDEFGNFVEKKNEDDLLVEEDEEEEEEKKEKKAPQKAPAAAARGRGGGARGGRGRGRAK